MMRQALLALAMLTTGLPGWAGEGFVEKDGIKIRYTVQGEGEPVVLIHGFGVNPAIQWDIPGVTPALAKDFKVITIDNRGHGRSSKPRDPDKYGMEMVEDVIRLLDHLDIRKAHLVGYSMGSFITQKIMTTHPDRVLSATLGGAGWVEKMDTTFVEGLAADLEAGRGVGLLMDRLTPPGKPKLNAEQLKGVNQMFGLLNDPKALAAVLRGWKQLAVSEAALKSCTVPTLALIGSDDPLKDGVDALPGRLKNLRVVVIRGADHMDTYGRPEFIKELQTFLSNQSPAGNGDKGKAPAAVKGEKKG